MTCTFSSCFFPDPLVSKPISLAGMTEGLHGSPGATAPSHMLPVFLAIPWESRSFPGVMLGGVYFQFLVPGLGAPVVAGLLAPWALPVPTTSAALHLQAASAVLGTKSNVVSSLSSFINSHLVSSFRSKLSFC